MKIAFYGDSLTEGIPGASYFALLQERLPEHELINYGEGDDTALSLYERIVEHDLARPVDMAFLWIGTNDVPYKESWAVAAFKLLRGKQWTENPGEFREYYKALLDLLTPYAGTVVTVSPLLAGEKLDTRHNRYLDLLSQVVRHVSAEYPNVRYLDVRSRFVEELAAKPIPDAASRSIWQTAWDVLMLRSPEEIDRAARERGLYLTLDGVHLNSRGAEIVVEAFMEAIREVERA